MFDVFVVCLMFMNNFLYVRIVDFKYRIGCLVLLVLDFEGFELECIVEDEDV